MVSSLRGYSYYFDTPRTTTQQAEVTQDNDIVTSTPDNFFLSDEETCTDGKDDGKISFKEGAISFLKGIASPITNMFKSPGNFIKSAAMIAVGTALCIATGGAAAPFLVALGVAGGGFQIAKGTIGIFKAKTDAEAKAALKNIGSGTGAVAASIVGAKAAARAGGIQGAKSMNAFQATVACIKNAPKSFGSIINVLRPSQIGASIGIVYNGLKGFFGELFSQNTQVTNNDILYPDAIDGIPTNNSNNTIYVEAQAQLNSSNIIYAEHTPRPMLQAPDNYSEQLASLLTNIRYSRLAST